MKLYSLLLTTLISTTAFADVIILKPNIDKIVSAASMNFDDDTYPDLAYLTSPEDQDEDQLDLWIKLSTQAEYIKVENITTDMNGGMYGMGTRLVVNELLGSLQIISFNDSVGRSRWEETVTLAFRNNSMVLAGYTYVLRDTLNGFNEKCDINALNKKGKYEVNPDGKKTYNVDFNIDSADILDLKNLNSEQLLETYMNDYCHSFDLNETE